MKNYNKLLHALRLTLFSVLAAGATACTSDLIEMDGGKMPSGKPGDPVGGLYSTRSVGLETQIQLQISDDVTETFVYRLTAPAEQDVTVTLEVQNWDMAACEQWNLANGFEKYWRDHNDPTKYVELRKKGERYPIAPENYYRAFPAELITLPADGVITIPAGKTESAPISIAIPTQELVEWSKYLLPLKVTSVTGVAPSVAKQSLLLRLKYDSRSKKYDIETENLQPDEIMTLFGYIDLTRFKPVLACAYKMNLVEMIDWGNDMVDYGYFRVYDAVLLQHAELKYDKATDRAVLTPTSDLGYVLSHDDEMLGRVRKNGIKVGVVLQGGKAGIGFRNMNDAQIADYVTQVRTLCTQYNLDCINLWDKNSGYGKDGMAPVNDTSYPKLIKALREALGKEKLITVVDDGENTANFYDKALCGGIQIGSLIDFAWEGRPYACTDPWDPASDRKPFDGLKKEQYTGLYANYYNQSDQSHPTSEQNPDGSMPTPFEKKMTKMTKDGGLIHVGATEISGFILGNEGIEAALVMWATWSGYGMETNADFMAQGLAGMVEFDMSVVEWGGYSNNFYYKDWD